MLVMVRCRARTECVLPWVRWETTTTVVCFCALSFTHARHSWELQRFFLIGLWSFSVNEANLLIKIDSTVLLFFYASQSTLKYVICWLTVLVWVQSKSTSIFITWIIPVTYMNNTILKLLVLYNKIWIIKHC